MPAPRPKSRHITRNGERAHRHVDASVLEMLTSDTAETARARLTQKRYGVLDVVLVTDASGKFVGVAPLSSVLTAPAATPMSSLIAASWPSIGPDLDQEMAVETASRAGVTVLPVVNGDGRAVGCITAKSLLEILASEHREDVHRMAGILRERRNERHALLDPPMKRLTRRLPWLLVGLAISTAGTGVMAGFEATLQANVAVAFFIPALVYLTDAIGTQTEAIAVRGLSIANQPFGRILLNEVVTGGLIGATLGAIAFIGVWLVFADPRLAMAVGLSLLVAGALACAIGLTLPWLLSRLGIDPALGSGPVATILQDVLTLMIYFAIVTATL
jgi:magnesium transporter